MGIKEAVSAPQSPWQNLFVEREIGLIKRECTDHVIVLSQGHLKNILCAYFQYCHNDRTHLSLGKDTPNGRPIHPQTCRQMQDNRFAAYRSITPSIRVEESSLKTQIALISKVSTVFADLCSESDSIKDFTLNPSFLINLTVGISFNRCTEENIF